MIFYCPKLDKIFLFAPFRKVDNLTQMKLYHTDTFGFETAKLIAVVLRQCVFIDFT